ncbi:MAG TPA: MBL fold metallo-hydrolase, partial [Acidimicrobiales bacterium]|nr:MBL fold metallo-hydrolase [Acidimicrobiales bacterium]
MIRLHMGHFIAPGHLPFAGAAIVVSAFLVRHPSGPVLLDTGIGVGLPEVETLYRPVRTTLDGVLRGAGVSVGDVRAVANCHLHFDHSGNNFRFPHVPILAQKVEREAVATPNYTLPGPVAEFDGANFELLEGEAEIVPGVRIIPTPGHVPGHQSFVVDTQEGRIVIAGQAFQDAATYARDLYAWRLDRSGAPHPEYPPWVAR